MPAVCATRFGLLARMHLDADTVRYQGNWIPHALRPATEDGIFFAGDSAGGETDPGRVDAWLSSVTAAVDELAATGVPRIGLVGIRMGGLFAAHEAARRGGVDQSRYARRSGMGSAAFGDGAIALRVAGARARAAGVEVGARSRSFFERRPIGSRVR